MIIFYTAYQKHDIFVCSTFHMMVISLKNKNISYNNMCVFELEAIVYIICEILYQVNIFGGHNLQKILVADNII